VLLASRPQTVLEMEAALQERFGDASLIAPKGSAVGALYLWGYVVELLLKTAFFRLCDPSTAPVVSNAVTVPDDWPRLRACAEDYAAGMGRSRRFVRQHDLRFWRDMLQKRRGELGLDITSADWRKIVAEVDWVDDNWAVALPYHESGGTTPLVSAADVADMLSRVDDLRNERVRMWS